MSKPKNGISISLSLGLLLVLAGCATEPYTQYPDQPYPNSSIPTIQYPSVSSPNRQPAQTPCYPQQLDRKIYHFARHSLQNNQRAAILCAQFSGTPGCWQRLRQNISEQLHEDLQLQTRAYVCQLPTSTGNLLYHLDNYLTSVTAVAAKCSAIGVPHCLSGHLARRASRYHRLLLREIRHYGTP